jgi:hypothetical protein
MDSPEHPFFDLEEVRDLNGYAAIFFWKAIARRIGGPGQMRVPLSLKVP